MTNKQIIDGVDVNRCECDDKIVAHGNFLRNNKITCCRECAKKANENE